MRILFVIHQFLPEFAAGTEQVTLNLARCARRSGHQVEVLTSVARDPALWAESAHEGMVQATAEGLRIFALAPELNPDPLGFAGQSAPGQPAHAAAAGFLKARGYDLVHVTHTMRMLPVLDAIRALRLPYLVTLTDFFLQCHRVVLSRLDGTPCDGADRGRNCARYCSGGGTLDPAMLERRAGYTHAVLKGATEVAACSAYVADGFRAEYPDVPVRVIPHGIDLLRFFAKPEPEPGPRAPVFGYVGTLSEAKGVGLLLDAFVQGAPAKARLELHGPFHGSDALRRQLDQVRLAHPNIVWSGPIARAGIPQLLQGFDALCLPSMVPESFSLVMAEAFAAGLPFITSDLGNPGRTVRAHGCGLVLPYGDVAAWAEAFAAIARDPGQLAAWRVKLPLPLRAEEEGSLYQHLYRAVEVAA